jgi:adenosylcobyric acid synthase
MLGVGVHDPRGLESDQRFAAGLGLLAVETELEAEKRLAQTHGRILEQAPGVWSCLGGIGVEGYEIHMGRTRPVAPHAPFLELGGAAEGSVSRDMPVVGSSLHGLLEQAEPRRALLRALADLRGFTWRHGAPLADPYDTIADVLEGTLRLEGLLAR